MIILLIYTGIRRGELCGLEWKDINYENNTMRICRTSQYIGNKSIITKEPKTKSGIRTISISTTMCTLLIEYYHWQNIHKKSLGDRWTENDRLFTSLEGTPIFPDTVTDWFAKFIRKNELPYVTLHSLRHPPVKLKLKIILISTSFLGSIPNFV